jgi:hypothetical protein
MKIKQNKIQNTKTNSIYLNYKYLVLLVLVLLIGVLCIYIYYKNQEPFENESNSNSNSNSNIIIPDIIGGLGNQLFVVASAFAFAKDNNYKLMLDNRKDVYSYGKPRETYNDTLFSKIPIYTTDKINFINMNENEYVSRTTNNSSNTITNSNIFLTGGYYQEAKYFDKYKNEILDLFEPTQDINSKVNELCKINNINISDSGDSVHDFLVAIHIRLDDVYTPIDSDKRVYDKDEYDIIIQKLPEHLQTNPNTKFIIFSNDIPRTKEIFKSAQIDSSKMIYIQSKDYIELALMTKCNNYIASPSTFNWWGIYLNKNPEKNIFIYWKQDSDYRKDFYKKYDYLKENNSVTINNIESFKNNNNYNNTDTDIDTNYNISNFTCVSGFWNVSNKHGNKFNDWFKNTLAINCPYVFFTAKENIKTIHKFRKDYTTYFIEKNINDFKTYNLNMKNKIHNTHVPSKELGLIWLEKMNLVLEASIVNPYKSVWFCWIDSGICIYRDKTPPLSPFPNPNKMHLLSSTQINYCTSETISNDNLNKIKNWEYIHNISGTSFILHISLIKKIYDLFYNYLNKCINETNEFICYSDQCIWSHIYVDYPELFNKIGDGYGNIIKELSYTDRKEK